MNKKSDEKLDRILKEALTKEENPSPMLNRQVLKMVQNNSVHMEENGMDRKKKLTKVAAVAVIVLGIMIAGGGTVYAAYRYLLPSQIAQNVAGNDRLAKAFESNSAIRIDESQTSGDYIFNLLGMVSGSEIEPYVTEDTQDKLSDKKTYAAVAISKQDGSKMTKDSFCVSPLIGGVPFMVANNATLDTFLIWFEQDGVIYELIECDDLEKFADKGVWISVVEDFGDETAAYVMDTDSGSYSKNESYEGVSALFKIPFDESKADKTAADQYIKNLEEKMELNDTEEPSDSDTERMEVIDQLRTELENMTLDEIEVKYKEVKEHEVTAKPDANGYINLTYLDDEGIACGMEGLVDALIPNDKDYMPTLFMEGDNATYGFEIIIRNEDGSFTLKEYQVQ